MEIIFQNFEMRHGVCGNVDSISKAAIIKGSCVNSLACRQSFAETLDEADEGDDSRDNFLQIFGSPSLFKSFDSFIEDQEGLTFIFDACEECLEIEVTAEFLQDALENESLLFLSQMSQGELSFLSNNDLSGSLSYVVPKAIIVLGRFFKIVDGSLSLLVNAVTVNYDVFADVDNGSLRIAEDSCHLGELLEVSCNTFAVTHGVFDVEKCVSNIFQSLNDISHILGFEVLVGLLHVIKSRLSIQDTVLNILELCMQCSHEYTLEYTLGILN